MVSGFCFMMSLFFPAFKLSDGDSFSGLALLMIGWYGSFITIVALFVGEFGEIFSGYTGWLANPLLFICYTFLLSRGHKQALLFGALSVIMALSSFLLEVVPVNESSGTATIVGYQLGFYFWLISCVVALLGSLVANRLNNETSLSRY